MVIYYSRFIPDVSTVTYPLHNLLRKNQKFYWNNKREQAFLKLNEEISSDRVLVPFDPELSFTLVTAQWELQLYTAHHQQCRKASCFRFPFPNRGEAERNYSQLDREASAIIFEVSHFINYIYSRHFVLITDNQPLSRLFHPKTGLPKMTLSQLLCYAYFLIGFDYTVKFRKGLKNQNLVCLSRAPNNQNCISADVSINDEVHQVCASAVFEISSENLTADAIIQETEKDQELTQIKRELLSSPINSDYILDNGILFKNNRIVIYQKHFNLRF
ncbi:hypothetical protein AVEN_41749-1 [Araneus ventricosus]|uniref:Reverse transcriptase/retrotransposon-derived protein RNase H-like domain-containing protein n=1 Tax=Araneus ventricosus TaxID=182803 RepID=A0A4Y2ABX2_ARAVE|nr:hypothetical protein AVEN_41749-1 [Araneus ventricosus]